MTDKPQFDIKFDAKTGIMGCVAKDLTLEQALALADSRPSSVHENVQNTLRAAMLYREFGA